MADVTLSKAVRSNLLNLQSTASQLAKTQERLATGLKVNSALDNPTNFFTASSLNSRASDMSNLLDSMSNGIKTIESADNGLKAITKTVESMQSTLRQARQDKTFKTTSIGVEAGATGNLSISGGAVGTTAVDIALTTTTNGTVVQGSITTAASSYTAPTAAQQGSVDTANNSYTAPTAAQQGSVDTANNSYTAPIAATASTITAGSTFTNIDLSNDAGDAVTFDITLGADTVSINLNRAGVGAGAGVDNTYDIDEAIAEIQAQLNAFNAGAGLGVTVGKDGLGTSLTFTADTAGATALTVNNGAVVDGDGLGGVVAAAANLGVTDIATTGQTDTGDAAEDRAITVNGEAITLTSANAATAEDAATVIQAALDAANINVTVTGSNADGKLSFVGSANGATDVTLGGADADDVFGASGTRTVVAAEEAEDRVISVNGESITLTSVNAATAEDAATVIQAALDAANIDVTVTGSNADGKLSFVGSTDGATDVTLGGADADDVFGASGTRTVVAAEEAEDRVISINGESVTLTSANAATASAAAATIQAALDAADIDVTITGNNTDGNFTITGLADGTNNPTIAGADADDVFGASGTRTVVTADDGDPVVTTRTVAELVTAINTTSALEGKVRASNDNGKLRIENLSTESLTLTGVDATTGDADGSVGTSSIGGNEVRKNLVKQFNELREQLDKLSDDASFNGINLLRGDKLKLTFNETGTSTIEIQATDSNGSNIAINTTSLGITAATNAQFDSDAQIDTLIGALGGSLNTLRSQASAFGSNLSIVENRQDFTKNMINTLETGAANLTLADTNEEAANLLALQTRQQLSSTALSLASQSDQNVLRLF